jgi:hypothetical protein
MRKFGAWSAATAWWLLAVGVLSSCADLPRIDQESCGNGVIDPGEECDKHADFEGAVCGAPGSAGQCRFLCTSGTSSAATSPRCPAGWGCGQDGLCRQPSGSFTGLSYASAEGASRIIIPADFDGDGRPTLILMADDDALGRRIARIVDPDSETSTSGSQVPVPMASPAIADLDGDRRADVAFADLRGIAVLRGNTQHQADFISYPASLLPSGAKVRSLVFDVTSDGDGDEIMAVVDRGSAGTTLERIADYRWPQTTLVSLPAGVDDLSGRLAWGKFDEREKACAAIVFPFTGRGSVSVFSPCRSGASGVEWNEGGAPTEISLPGGATVAGPVRIADLNHDGHLDILIAGHDTPDATDVTGYVAYGAGDGSFRSQPTKGDASAASVFPLVKDDDGANLFPLAVAELNKDALIDFVVPGGIYLSQPDGSYSLQAKNFAADWDEAIVADLNGDSELDVLGASAGELDLQFFNNAGDGLFNVSSVPTGGPPSNLVVGDFDGDLVNDVAFAERNQTLGDGWSVAFGAPRGSPSTVRRMGRLSQIEQIVSGRLPDRITGVDGIDDLVLISAATKSDDRFVVALGRGERVMLAPLTLQDSASTDLPIAIAAGHLVDAATSSLITIGKSGDSTSPLRLWLRTPTRGDTGASALLPPQFHSDQDGGFRYGIHVATGDLDGDHVDEAVVIGPYGSADNQSAMIIVRFDATTGQLVVGQPQVFDAQSTLYSPLTLADVDADGAVDVVYKPVDDSPSNLLVFWNDHSGGLDVTRSSSIDYKGKTDEESGLFAFACVQVNQACSLHVVSPTQTFSVTFDAARQPTLHPIADLPGGRAIAAADFDGDGLDDLALGDDSGMQVYHSEPILK